MKKTTLLLLLILTPFLLVGCGKEKINSNVSSGYSTGTIAFEVDYEEIKENSYNLSLKELKDNYSEYGRPFCNKLFDDVYFLNTTMTWCHNTSSCAVLGGEEEATKDFYNNNCK